MKKKHVNVSEFLEKIISLLPGHVYWLDKNNVYLGSNEQMARASGLSSREEIIGKRNADLPWNFDKLALVEVLDKNNREIMESGIPQTFEEPGTLPDGNEAVFLSNKSPVYDENGEIIGLVGVSLNITALKKLENELRISKDAAEKSGQALSQIFSFIGEELKEPYYKIIEQASILYNHVPLGQKRLHAKEIMDESQRGIGLVTDLAEFSKLKTGSTKLHSFGFLDFKQLLEEIVASNTTWANQKTVNLLVDYPYGIPVWIGSDKYTLRKAIAFLLNFAIETSEKNQILIKVEISDKKRDSMKFKLSIQSQGDLINRTTTIIDTTSKSISVDKAKDGSLGLEYVKNIVVLLGGELFIEHKMGEGLRIYLSMVVPVNKMSPIAQLPWEKYYAHIPILILDSEGRGEIIKKHLGSLCVDILNNEDDIQKVLTKKQSENNPYNIVIVGRIGKGELQSSVASRVCKNIRTLKNIEKPMLLFLLDKESLDVRRWAENTGYYSSILSTLPPTELQTELTARWESWLEQTTKKD